MSNALFIIGNKRSGTSQLVRLLNLHPNIFVSHESDIIWILYQFHNGKPFAAYPSDSSLGMDVTLKTCVNLLKKNENPANNFFAIEKCMMERGSPWLPAMSKKKLFWVGDKKPFQCADPLLVDFIRDIFPNAAFIHLIRHPFDVAYSAEQFNKTPEGDFWKGLTLDEKIQEWTKNEKNVLELKKSGWARVLDVRYEDLCRNTQKELRRIYSFLGVDLDRDLLENSDINTHYTVKKIPNMTCDEETRSVMKLYGYTEKEARRNGIQIFFTNKYWNLRKKLL